MSNYYDSNYDTYLGMKLVHTKKCIEILSNYKKLYDNGNSASEIKFGIEDLKRELKNENQRLEQIQINIFSLHVEILEERRKKKGYLLFLITAGSKEEKPFNTNCA